MRYFLTPLALASSAAVMAQAKMFHWPNRQMEMLDTVFFEQTAFQTPVSKCVVRDNSTVAAQWVRMAFHDIATHNIDDGTGGMDSSVFFELDRGENAGLARAFPDFLGFGSRLISLADLIAAGAIVASLECNGPVFPYRAGRVDATGQGGGGAPKPFLNLTDLQESFRRQGFNNAEMIGLTACGHAFGGVTKKDFPDVMQDERQFQFFNNRTTLFDNGIVTQYLEGTTFNPLVVGVNATTNSDIRVFNSDQNATVKGLADPAAFTKTCTDLFTRMLNVVPAGVTLTDVIEPWDYKVGEARISVANNTDKLSMSTTLRLLNPKDNPRRQVKLVWVDTHGRCSQWSGCSALASGSTPITGSTFFQKGFGKTAIQYNFNIKDIDPSTSIGKFWFEIDERDGSRPTEVKNDDGKGYNIAQDDVLFDVTRSTLFTNADGTNFTSQIVIAVKDNLAGKAPINVETVDAYTAPLKYDVHEAKLDTRFKKTAGYTFFSLTPPTFRNAAFDVYYGQVVPQNLKVQHGQVAEALSKVQSLS
ncbi:hypothetical protein E1B28_011955 [Marasmius oreades]|uniref:Peroxidase n=1 Tax=Marasmius oreades TaxID=181124 RepID=A0A9P7RR10_9AGAR|nr:uncharacterized protein E1B28_011955 [Marasmius oreades]KAG7087907.1 hypothetical protein E1B28_011955 [Marasmius oreades]